MFEFLARRGSLVIRRVGGLEVPDTPDEQSEQVIRRVGGLEDERLSFSVFAAVIRRVGGLEVSGRTPRVRTR